MLDWTRAIGDKCPFMLHTVIIVFLLTFSCVPASAARVVFLELHQNGMPVALEPGGRFFHVAIQYREHWLQAHSHGGVSLVKDIRDYGDAFMVLDNPDCADPDPAFVERWLGKPFDFSYAWENPKATYCTRLVADILRVPPQPMSFAADIWKHHYHKPDGEPGLSPDKLYAELLRRGFKSVPCALELELL